MTRGLENLLLRNDGTKQEEHDRDMEELLALTNEGIEKEDQEHQSKMEDFIVVSHCAGGNCWLLRARGAQRGVERREGGENRAGGERE